MLHVPEKFRDKATEIAGYGKTAEGTNNGVLMFPVKSKPRSIARAIVSDGAGWEHVSISLKIGLTPTWEQMCEVKDLFWDKADCVVQYHPAESEYVNVHETCLHLWRPTTNQLPSPPSYMVG